MYSVGYPKLGAGGGGGGGTCPLCHSLVLPLGGGLILGNSRVLIPTEVQGAERCCEPWSAKGTKIILRTQ